MEPTASPSAAPGRLVGGIYRLERCLGRGGMGEVFEARHERLGMLVALKFLRRELALESRTRARFEREARAQAGIGAENVVRVFDCGEHEGVPFMVMEHLRGEDLRATLLKEGMLPVRRALHLALDVSRGLAALHAAEIVHRDLKPANIFLTCDALGKEVAKVLDLGVARIAEGDLTRNGSLIGTVRYMAPEQLLDGARASVAADIYAVGAVLFECLTGSAAQPASDLDQLMFEILNRRPPAVTTLNPNVPRTVAELVTRLLSRDPEQRPDCASALAQHLMELLQSPQPPSAGEQTSATTERPQHPRLQRRRVWRAPVSWLAIGSALSLSSLGIAMRHQAHGVETAPSTQPTAVAPGAGSAALSLTAAVPEQDRTAATRPLQPKAFGDGGTSRSLEPAPVAPGPLPAHATPTRSAAARAQLRSSSGGHAQQLPAAGRLVQAPTSHVRQEVTFDPSNPYGP